MDSPTHFNFRMDIDDVDALGESLPDWNVEFRQLHRGSFRGIITQIGREGWVAGHAGIAQRTEQVGLAPADVRTIVVTGRDKGTTMRWRGHEIGCNDLMIFPENGELHAVGDKYFNIFTLSFKREELQSMARRADLTDPDHFFDKTEVLRIAPHDMAALRRTLNLIMRTTRSEGEDHPLRPNPLRVLAATLAGANDHEPSRTKRIRKRALTEAVKLLRADRKGEISIGNLAKGLQVSPRTLDAIFLDNLGVTPAAYRKALRLNAVHRMLHRADPAKTKVRDIAQTFGFIHMSQFAADYRAHFQVLPSESLSTVIDPRLPLNSVNR